MKIKTSEATPLQLNWLVAVCEGMTIWPKYPAAMRDGYSPSTDWSQGGPIIEREKLIFGYIGEVWECRYFDEGKFKNCEYGPTPLTAAMRCYVASKMGDTVDVPDELA